MSLSEGIRTILEVILPVLTYFAGVHRGKLKAKRDEQKEEARAREERIRCVVDEYMKMKNDRGIANGFHSLIVTGVANLKNDSEIRDACRKIEERGLKYPLKGYNFNDIDTYVFFNVAIKRGYDFLGNGDVQTLLSELRKK